MKSRKTRRGTEDPGQGHKAYSFFLRFGDFSTRVRESQEARDEEDLGQMNEGLKFREEKRANHEQWERESSVNMGAGA